MSYRKNPLVNQHYYHIFNRGVARQPTFLSSYDYSHAELALSYYIYKDPAIPISRYKELSQERRQEFLKQITQNERLVSIAAYVFMPNHFHLLLKQVLDGGISEFMSKFTNSYTRYFNTKHNRVGPVFQGRFKSVLVESTEQLIHLSRYIHLNPVASAVIREEELDSYKWSSFPSYLRKDYRIVDPREAENIIASVGDYKSFVFDHVAYAKDLEKIKHLSFEDE